MSIQNVNIGKLHALNGCLNCFFNVFFVKSSFRIYLRISALLNFGGNNDWLPLNFKVFEDLSKGSLALSFLIDFCSVEMIDSNFETLSDDIFVLLVSLRSGIDDFSKSDSGYFESWIAKIHVLHLWC